MGSAERNLAPDRLCRSEYVVDLTGVHFCVPALIADFCHRLANRLLPGQAEHLQQSFVGVDEVMIAVEYVGKVRGVAENGFVKAALTVRVCTRVAQCNFIALLIGDVNAGPDKTSKAGVLINTGRAAFKQ